MIKWLVAAFVLIFVVYQVYASVYNPLTTESASYTSTYSAQPIEGIVIRNETVVENSVSGIYSYEVQEGGRVSKGGTIAKVYQTEAQAQARVTIAELDDRIRILEETQSYNDDKAADLDLINAKLRESFIQMVDIGKNGKYSNYTPVSDELLRLMNRKQIVTGEAQQFTAKIAELKAQRDILNESYPESANAIKSPHAGYFIYNIDGGENADLYTNLDSITPSVLQNYIQSINVTASSSVGKVVSDFEWYIAANIPFEFSYEITQGQKMRLKTGLSTVPELDVVVKSINRQEAGKEAVVVFSCKTMNSELAAMRIQKMEIITASYEGLRIPSDAIRIQDNVRGVYVLAGTQAVFKPINVVYSYGKYSICEQQNSVSGALRLYDEVIVKGKNLYDGKIIG